MARTKDTGTEEFSTPAQKKKLFEEYLEHCRQGLSDECFPPCDIGTFNAIAAENPTTFLVGAIARARRERRLFWEKSGITGILGKIRGFNAAAWKSGAQEQFGDDSNVPIFTRIE